VGEGLRTEIRGSGGDLRLINTIAFHFFDPPCGGFIAAPMQEIKASRRPSFEILIIN
jgi:hypothetical protein